MSCGDRPVLRRCENVEEPSMMHTMKLEKIRPKGGGLVVPELKERILT